MPTSLASIDGILKVESRHPLVFISDFISGDTILHITHSLAVIKRGRLGLPCWRLCSDERDLAGSVVICQLSLRRLLSVTPAELFVFFLSLRPPLCPGVTNTSR